MKYSETLAEQMFTFGIRPIVLVRDVFDCRMSLRDHIRRESHIFPLAFGDKSFASFDDAKLELFLASTAIPWYFNFFLSWSECQDKLLVNYNDILKNPTDVVASIMLYQNQLCSDKDILEAVNKANTRKTRKNIAIAGRGKEISKPARDKILEIASFYQHYDLSQIGIPKLE